jgi:hypothetical protein
MLCLNFYPWGVDLLSSRTKRFADDKAKPGKPGDATLEGPKERSRAASYRIGKYLACETPDTRG